MALENRHPDIVELDGASNRGIENIRELIEQTRYHPITGRFKIFIIDEVHMLTPEAFNAFLKTLEEPPSYVKFILATTDPLKLPQTILSRVQHFRFGRVREELIISHLKKILQLEGVKFQEEAVRLIAQAGRGSVRDSLTILDQIIGYAGEEITTEKVVEILGIVHPHLIEKLFNAIFSQNTQEVEKLLPTLERFDLESVVEESEIYLANRLREGNLSPLILHRFLNIIADARELLRTATPNPYFFLGYLFFRLLEATKPYSVAQLLKELEGELETPQRKFSQLIKELKERDLELGVCFETSIRFISFQNGVLKWESCPERECRRVLKRYFTLVIRPLIDKIFGAGTAIEVIRCDTPSQNSLSHSPSLSTSSSISPSPSNSTPQSPQPEPPSQTQSPSQNFPETPPLTPPQPQPTSPSAPPPSSPSNSLPPMEEVKRKIFEEFGTDIELKILKKE
jgi:DNA polymerase-3 subunit gamma/tau